MGELISEWTGLRDRNGQFIHVGDIVNSIFGYNLLVCKDREDGHFYGSLICEIGHSCRNIGYNISNSKEELLIWQLPWMRPEGWINRKE